MSNKRLSDHRKCFFLLKCTSPSILLTKFYCFMGRHVGSLGNRPEREGFLFMNILCVIHYIHWKHSSLYSLILSNIFQTYSYSPLHIILTYPSCIILTYPPNIIPTYPPNTIPSYPPNIIHTYPPIISFYPTLLISSHAALVISSQPTLLISSQPTPPNIIPIYPPNIIRTYPSNIV